MGIILESPFTSMVKLAKKYYPYLPVKLVLKDKYETIRKLDQINSPILILHGAKDNIVPFEMGLKIYEIANSPKYKYFNDNDDHMMDYNEDLVQSIRNFINTIDIN